MPEPIEDDCWIKFLPQLQEPIENNCYIHFLPQSTECRVSYFLMLFNSNGDYCFRFLDADFKDKKFLFKIEGQCRNTYRIVLIPFYQTFGLQPQTSTYQQNFVKEGEQEKICLSQGQGVFFDIKRKEVEIPNELDMWIWRENILKDFMEKMVDEFKKEFKNYDKSPGSFF